MSEFFNDDFDDFDDTSECECNVIGCDECDERALENFDCGKLPSGLCMKAGSEECDFECPNRD